MRDMNVLWNVQTGGSVQPSGGAGQLILIKSQTGRDVVVLAGEIQRFHLDELERSLMGGQIVVRLKRQTRPANQEQRSQFKCRFAWISTNFWSFVSR